MRSSTIIGLALIVLGIIVLVYQGFTYTTHEKIVDLGPIQATKTEQKTIPLSPVLGAIALAGGILIIALDRRKS